MTLLLSVLRKLPNWSSMRICGCGANETPATAVPGNWGKKVKLLAAPGVTVKFPQVGTAQLALPKTKVIVLALVLEKIVKFAQPFPSGAAGVPLKPAYPSAP